MNNQIISDTYSKAATATEESLCCAVDYREEFSAEELDHIPKEVLDRNYGCGVPPQLSSLGAGRRVLDLGPGLGRDCFIASHKVGPEGQVFGLDMNEEMLRQAERYKNRVVDRLGYDNIQFLKGKFDVYIPLEKESIDVIFFNCVNNLALDKDTAYREMFRVLRRGSSLSFSDIVSYQPLPEPLRQNERAWAECVAGVLSFQELTQVLGKAGFHGVTLRTDYLWKTGEQVLEEYFSSISTFSPEERSDLKAVRLYAVTIEAFKPVLDPKGECYWRGQYAIYQGPGVGFQLDEDPDHLFTRGVLKEVCEKTATLLKSEPFRQHFTVFEPAGEVEARLCVPGAKYC